MAVFGDYACGDEFDFVEVRTLTAALFGNFKSYLVESFLNFKVLYVERIEVAFALGAVVRPGIFARADEAVFVIYLFAVDVDIDELLQVEVPGSSSYGRFHERSARFVRKEFEYRLCALVAVKAAYVSDVSFFVHAGVKVAADAARLFNVFGLGFNRYIRTLTFIRANGVLAFVIIALAANGAVVRAKVNFSAARAACFKRGIGREEYRCGNGGRYDKH